MPDHWTEILRSRAAAGVSEAGLVLTAVGVPCMLGEDAFGYTLLVPAADVARAHDELNRYIDENRTVPREPEPALYPRALPWTGVAIAVCYLVALAASQHWLGYDWLGAGILEPGAVRAGAWWRAVTALTLHANAAHLASNAGFGLLFGGAAAALYGPGVGWLAIVLSATVANAIEAWLLPTGAGSLGASTAVFAALGLVAARAPTRGLRPGVAHGVQGAIIAAALLLALVGTGDAQTDVNGHALGFAAGLAVGLGLRPVGYFPPPAQRVSGLLAVLAVAGAWYVALQT